MHAHMHAHIHMYGHLFWCKVEFRNYDWSQRCILVDHGIIEGNDVSEMELDILWQRCHFEKNNLCLKDVIIKFPMVGYRGCRN